jgi:hypothetical protein
MKSLNYGMILHDIAAQIGDDAWAVLPSGDRRRLKGHMHMVGTG